MKRIFCDCCGDEMQYDEQVRTTMNAQREGQIHGKVQKVNVAMWLDVKAVKVPDGEHFDLCVACRWRVVDLFDPRPQAVEHSFTRMSPDQVSVIFGNNSSKFNGNYEITPGQARDIYRALFGIITGERP